MIEPNIIRSRIALLKLEGRKIERMKLVGHSYPHDRNWIEERAYVSLDQYDEEERQLRSEYNNISRELLYDRYAETDEPFMIKFEDGDIFEIETPQVPEFRFSINRIPWTIRAGTNLSNLDANVMFAPCIGRTISAVEIKTYMTDKDPMIWDEYIDENHSNHELVEAIVLRLDNGDGIRIEGHIDFCVVSLIDAKDELLSISFRELKLGLYNWEDLYVDPDSGFRARTGTFFFGHKGTERVDHPYISLSPKGKRSMLSIGYFDFDFFKLVLSWQIKEPYVEYDNYEFTADQWREILKKAELILSFDSFDDLFDCLTRTEVYNRYGTNMFLVLLNCGGAKLWKQREKYRTQLQDLKEWTNLVLTDSDSMEIQGF